METSTKKCSLDSIPTDLLKRKIVILITHITVIINKSLTTGIFSDLSKEALVTHILKNKILKQYIKITDLYQIYLIIINNKKGSIGFLHSILFTCRYIHKIKFSL